MSEYIIFNTNVDGYDRYVLFLSFESLFFYIRKIEILLAEGKREERILIEQLLITCNGTNRYMSRVVSDGRLDFRTA